MMNISSDKANKRAEKVIAFAGAHRWAKLPCVGAVSVIYSAEFLRVGALSLGERIRNSAEAEFRPLGGRVLSALLSASFAFMTVPFSAAAADGDDAPSEQTAAVSEMPEDISGNGDMTVGGDTEEAAEDTEQTSGEQPYDKTSPEARAARKARRVPARTAEAIAERVTLAGLAEDNPFYGITLNIKSLKANVTARFRKTDDLNSKVKAAFDYYGISVSNLYIEPVDITLYTTEEKYRLQLSEGYSADITLPIPEGMNGHLDDMKIIRLEDNGGMTILDGEISQKGSGNVVSFNTDHFSVFALVCYSDNVEPEDVGSGAGTSAAGTNMDISLNPAENVFDTDKRRQRKAAKRKVYRIRRIIKENDLLL